MTYTIIGGDGKEYGPITADDLRKWIAEGRLNAQSLAKAESDAEFRALDKFPEFADALGISTAASDAPPPLTSPANVLERDYELDIGGCVSRSWALLKNNFWPAVGVSALIFLLIAAFNQLTGLLTRPVIDQMIHQRRFSAGGILMLVGVSIVCAPVYMILMAGLVNYFLKLIRRQPAQVGDAFSGFGPMAGHLILLGLVANTLVMVGYVFCVIPGIFLQVAWLFAIVLVIDRRMNFWDAMEFSRKQVCKHWFIVFAFFIVYSLIVMAGVLACCVGVFVSIPISIGAWMYAYEDIFGGSQTG